MAYRLTGYVTIGYVGDGIGPMAIMGSPSFRWGNTTTIVVPGGNAPTSGNFGTAIDAFGTDIKAQVQAAATLALIQGWATGANN